MHYSPNNSPAGFKRGEDGVLEWHSGGTRYIEPKEAVKTWWAGKQRLGCTEATSGFGYIGGPCGNTAKHDPDANGNPTKCGVHSTSAKQSRKAKQDASYAKWTAAAHRGEAIRKAERALEAALRQIATGHNDPRTLAQDVLAALDAARNMGGST